ncbi:MULTISPECIES: PAS domain S-box protein [unclassified Leptolyngbya]|uniref:PAS domain S-box protein n=1 Tax=unclassified Leptolyngbya TaxID=2650499 RepID=UPI0018EF5818|nr:MULTISPECIES: PAS domain S-box protein [unclassified Leptolyngbya]
MRRDKTGRFIPNWTQEIKHAVNLSLTQTAWQLLEKQAQNQGISRSELIECFARSLAQAHPALIDHHGSVQAASPTDRSVASPLKEQEFLQVLLDNVQAGIVACDADGELKLFNQVARSFHGLPEKPLPPEQWAEFYDLYLPDGKTPMATQDIPLFRALQGESVHQMEMMIIPKQGLPRTLLANAEAIVTPTGKKLGAVVVMHDITERKQIEMVLRDRETQLQSIFQTIPDGIVILDRSGQITAANPAAEAILRLTNSNITERIYNNPSWTITTVEGLPFPEEELPFVRVIATGQPVYGVEHAITHTDGTTIILSINASPLFDADGQMINIVTALSDITARKKADAALRESEERYRSVIEMAAEGIILQYADGKIFTCNTSAEQILGQTAEQLMGRTSLDPGWQSIYEDGSPFPGNLHPSMVTLRTGEPQSNVIMGIRKPDETLTWISINTRPLFRPKDTKPFAVVASFFDITQRKQVEEQRSTLIQEQAARLAAETAQQQSAFLAEVSAVLSSSLDYEQTLQSVADLAVPRVADWCSVDLVSDDRIISRVAVAHTDPEKVKFAWEVVQRFPPSLDNNYGIAQVIKSGRSEIAAHITDEQLAVIQNQEYLQVIRGLGIKSCIIAPLEARGRVLGTISFIYSESNRQYGKADLILAEDLARRAAIAIDNARLFQEAQQACQAAEKAADRTARLQTIMAALSESLTPQQVADVIVQQSIAALSADSALMTVLTDDEKELEIIKAVGYHTDIVESWRRFPVSAAVPLADAVRTGTPVWAETKAERLARYPHLADIYSRYDFNSWISLPLMSEGKAVGGMLLSFKEHKSLSQDDRDFILAVSRQCAQAISRAQAYEAERKARAEAEAANRIKDEFLAVLSHELRSPLNPILGWAKLLQTRKLDAAKVTEALKIIERNARLQSELIEDLLDVSRILQGKLSLNRAAVDLTTTIHAALETVRLSAEAKAIQIETQLATNVGQVLGDSSRLQQVVWNLLSNAVKFTPEGGKVHVQLEQMGSYAQIIVSDTGKGIAPEFLPHVFEYFRQADATTTRKFGGLGLGLAIVRHLVELHGGTIQVESPGEGQGATFTVQLPLLAKISPASPVGELHTHLPSLNGIKALVVDDDADARDLVAFLLEHEQATVITASSASEALIALAKFQPDILLSDIGMPDMDGYMLLQKVRSLPPDQGGLIPAIALSAYAAEYDQRQALRVGFQKHIPKPVDPETLIKAISEYIHVKSSIH